VFVAVGLVVAITVCRRPRQRLAAVVAAIAVPGMIGISSLVLAAHWPTDVLAGWALGAAVAIFFVLLGVATQPEDALRV
jgi:undecaprenyl-diphosphatase